MISPLISVTIPKVGRKTYILIGNLIMVAVSVGFALLDNIKKDNLFLIISLILRFIQGSGHAMVSTSIFSIVGTEMVEN